MARPEVSVVMPFAGDAAAGREAIETLLGLAVGAGDELILVDNAGTVEPVDGVTVLSATGERSPAHARNVGAASATREWILFLDADCRAPADLLDAYFHEPVAADVGALAGEVIGAPEGASLAERYGASRNFLGQQVHLAHPFLPRAVAANLMVSRKAFESLGGFYEGIKAAEDTDFSWRLQRSGWRLEPRAVARVEHHYRTTVGELRRQWRGYAAGRAWLARRYEGFSPEPAVRRAFRRRSARAGGDSAADGLDRRFRVIDAVLAGEELAGMTMSNRPRARRRSPLVQVVLVADRFPALDDPRAEFVSSLAQPRVEAAARPTAVDLELARTLSIDYREDDGALARLIALLALAARHPVRCVRDLFGHRGEGPSLLALAPAALRLARDEAVRVRALGGSGPQSVAQRLAALTGRRLDS